MVNYELHAVIEAVANLIIITDLIYMPFDLNNLRPFNARYNPK